MKKILCMIISVMLIVASVPVLAADRADVSIDVSLYDVNITVKTDKSGTMTARIMNNAETAFYGMYSKAVNTATHGDYVYEFHFRLPDGTNRAAAPTGVYKIAFGNNVTIPDKTFNFVTPGDRITFYNELNDKASDALYTFLTVDRKSFVTVDLTEYSALTGNVLNLVNAEIVAFGDTYTDITAGDTEALSVVETGFKTVFDSAMTIAKMATVTEDDWEEFAEDMLLASAFDDKYYTATAPAEPLLALENVYENYKTEASKVSVLDATEYAKAFDKATLNLIEQTADYTTFKTAFLYMKDKGVISPDMTNINALISAEKDADLWKNVMAIENTDCDTLVANVVSEAQRLMDGGVTNPPSVGGGGFGAGGSSSVDKPSVPSGSGTVSGENTPEIKPVEPSLTGTFGDVEKTHWAYEAIEELADKGILNGKGDGSFAPNDGVTREEFVKIIVVAFDLKADGENTFADVEADRWSADFIKAAASCGIVSGDGENFNPEAVITRQDMAVIIHRVFEHLGAKVSGDAISFDDDADIADYARDAVNVLTGAGIINGMGDGTFAPKATVTRAQSAKVVYGLLQLIGGGK